MTPVQPAPPFFIYDGDCGFCRRWAAWLAKRLPPGTPLYAFQEIDDLAAFSLSPSDVRTASYWIDDAGTVHRGAGLFAHALRGTGLPWGPTRPLLRAPFVRVAARRAYKLIAGTATASPRRPWSSRSRQRTWRGLRR